MFYLSLLFCFLIGCSGLEKSEQKKIRELNTTTSLIRRHHDEILFPISTPKPQKQDPYPFENKWIGSHLKITKEFFRCKGSPLNPPINILNKELNTNYYLDCGGVEGHSLPLKEGKEFIYPILIDLLNYVQEKTEKKVIITSGHRCPIHNIYATSSTGMQSSKHLIGAEVDFYVKGLEDEPEKVVSLLINYFQDKSGLNPFSQAGKPDPDATTPPWFNQEVLIKLYKAEEGRNRDNQHSYPYLSIQVRYDKESKRGVSYSWHQAYNGYLKS